MSVNGKIAVALLLPLWLPFLAIGFVAGICWPMLVGGFIWADEITKGTKNDA